MNFILKPKAKKFFYLLQNTFITAPMLRHFDSLLSIHIETNASGFAISDILLQHHPESGHWHPLAFWSRKKASAEMNYGIRESKMLAIVEVCKQWRYYFEGATYQVAVITDHANLQCFLIDKSLNQRKAQ